MSQLGCLSILLFSLIGLLADVRFTRYRMMQASFVILSVTLILFLIIYSTTKVIFSVMLRTHTTKYASIQYIIVIVTIISSIGLFEANSIQVGVNQLLEASSTQLSQFIHWYFWFMHLDAQVVFLCC